MPNRPLPVIAAARYMPPRSAEEAIRHNMRLTEETANQAVPGNAPRHSPTRTGFSQPGLSRLGRADTSGTGQPDAMATPTPNSAISLSILKLDYPRMRRGFVLAALVLPLSGCYVPPGPPGYAQPNYPPPGYPPPGYDPYGAVYPGYSYNDGSPTLLVDGAVMPLIFFGGGWGLLRRTSQLASRTGRGLAPSGTTASGRRLPPRRRRLPALGCPVGQLFIPLAVSPSRVPRLAASTPTVEASRSQGRKVAHHPARRPMEDRHSPTRQARGTQPGSQPPLGRNPLIHSTSGVVHVRPVRNADRTPPR